MYPHFISQIRSSSCCLSFLYDSDEEYDSTLDDDSVFLRDCTPVAEDDSACFRFRVDLVTLGLFEAALAEDELASVSSSWTRCFACLAWFAGTRSRSRRERLGSLRDIERPESLVASEGREASSDLGAILIKYGGSRLRLQYRLVPSGLAIPTAKSNTSSSSVPSGCIN